MEATLDAGTVILDRIARREVKRARLEAETTADMLEFADLRRREAEWTDNPVIRRLEVSFAADELGAVLKQPTQTVQCRLAEARRVRGLLPLTWMAHLRGDIDAWRVRLIASTAGTLCEPESLLKLDEKVAGYASNHTASQIKAWLRRFVARVEADRHTERTKRELSQRVVWVDHDDGVSWLHAMIPTADAVRIDAALTHRAKLLPSDDRTLDHKRADVLADLLVGRDGTGTTRAGAIIAVTIPIASLASITDEPGISFDGEFTLPAELVRELAAESGTVFHRLMTDPEGRILDVTEIGRFPSPRLRIAVQARDGTCRVPACSRPAAECDLDHEEAHPRGPTSGTNLQALCRRHHRMKTYLDINIGGLAMRSTPSHAEHDFATWQVNLAYAA